MKPYKKNRDVLLVIGILVALAIVLGSSLLKKDKNEFNSSQHRESTIESPNKKLQQGYSYIASVLSTAQEHH